MERTGVKRVADTRVEDIDPSAGDGTDVVNMEEETRVESTQFRPLSTDEPAGPPRLTLKIKLGPGPLAKLRQCNSVSRPEQTLRGTNVPEDELKWRQIGSGMYARTLL